MRILIVACMVMVCADCFGQTPSVFMPGIISDGFENRDMAISPDNNEMYYTIQHRSGIFSAIAVCKKVNGKWSNPEIASFSGKFNDLEPAFSPDGKKLFFTSNRPLSDTSSQAKDYDLWYFEKKENKWEGPYNMGPVVNTDKDEFYASCTKNGNIYFTRDNDKTKDDIFIAEYKNGKYQTPAALPEPVNSAGFDFNAFIDPDEKYIIFSSYKRSDDAGGGDLYISKKTEQGWQPVIHLDTSGFNSTTLDYSPFVSFDKKYFFFTSKRITLKFPLKERGNLKEIQRLLGSAGNGSDDIYVVDYSVLEKLLK